ncbi:hypothetical protein BD626DRAFT_576215 [Schizophyllum amplum]|uniref:Uncharacterized protein n=1 Tax=Schizophyllum amplum TaxID=97359 RepID=A0A550BTX6_9AGAR|nr:hypothetical protein BD626DRAFT_576215 [Auriculariopsis ampla]
MDPTPPSSLASSYRSHRTPSASTLWAHLIRKDSPLTSSPTMSSAMLSTPVAPLDKTGTSMRMLLHDTQANFESFSSRVDKLLDAVENTKSEMEDMKQMMRAERESTASDMIDLVNRCQREIQKSLGEPTQSAQTRTLSSDIFAKLDVICSRLDSMDQAQKYNNQLLHSQTQYMRQLQDQSTLAMNNISPILPNIQKLATIVDASSVKVTENLHPLILSSVAQSVSSSVLTSVSDTVRSSISDCVSSVLPGAVFSAVSLSIPAAPTSSARSTDFADSETITKLASEISTAVGESLRSALRSDIAQTSETLRNSLVPAYISAVVPDVVRGVSDKLCLSIGANQNDLSDKTRLAVDQALRDVVPGVVRTTAADALRDVADNVRNVLNERLLVALASSVNSAAAARFAQEGLARRQSAISGSPKKRRAPYMDSEQTRKRSRMLGSMREPHASAPATRRGADFLGATGSQDAARTASFRPPRAIASSTSIRSTHNQTLPRRPLAEIFPDDSSPLVTRNASNGTSSPPSEALLGRSTGSRLGPATSHIHPSDDAANHQISETSGAHHTLEGLSGADGALEEADAEGSVVSQDAYHAAEVFRDAQTRPAVDQAARDRDGGTCKEVGDNWQLPSSSPPSSPSPLRTTLTSARSVAGLIADTLRTPAEDVKQNILLRRSVSQLYTPESSSAMETSSPAMGASPARGSSSAMGSSLQGSSPTDGFQRGAAVNQVPSTISRKQRQLHLHQSKRVLRSSVSPSIAAGSVPPLVPGGVNRNAAKPTSLAQRLFPPILAASDTTTQTIEDATRTSGDIARTLRGATATPTRKKKRTPVPLTAPRVTRASVAASPTANYLFQELPSRNRFVTPAPHSHAGPSSETTMKPAVSLDDAASTANALPATSAPSTSTSVPTTVEYPTAVRVMGSNIQSQNLQSTAFRTPVPATVMFHRERRSPSRPFKGRRFIPLDDSDDEIVD